MKVLFVISIMTLISVSSYADCPKLLTLQENNQLIGTVNFSSCSSEDLKYLSGRIESWIKYYSETLVLSYGQDPHIAKSTDQLDLQSQISGKIATLGLIRLEASSRK